MLLRENTSQKFTNALWTVSKRRLMPNSFAESEEFNRVSFLLDQLGFKSTITPAENIVLFTHQLRIFVRDINNRYKIVDYNVEDDVRIYSVCEPWLVNFLVMANEIQQTRKSKQK
jgi:hypothetical protein